MLTQQTAKQPKRLVVLGGSGFVGRHVAHLSRSRGVETLSLSSSDLNLAGDDAAQALSDILHSDDVVLFCSAIDKGSKSGSDTLIQNVTMAHQVAKATRQTPITQLIYLSSDSVYPFGTGLTSEATPPSPTMLYGAMHLSRELTLKVETDVPLAILRLTGIFGVGDAHQAYGPNRFLQQALDGNPIKLFGQGEEMRDHLYAPDVAAMIWQVIVQQETGTLNLATGQSISFYDIAKQLAGLAGSTIETTPRQQAITHRHYDVTKRLKSLPSVTPTPLNVALKEIWAELTQNQANSASNA